MLVAMIDLTQPVGRRELLVHLQEHALHVARLATALQQDLPSQIAGSNLVSSSVQAVQVARRFQRDPSTDNYEQLAEILESQAAWFELLDDAELVQTALLLPHRERVLDLLEHAFNRAI